jgi:hypothetical protein
MIKKSFWQDLDRLTPAALDGDATLDILTSQILSSAHEILHG